MKTTPVEGVVGAGLPASRRLLEGRRRVAVLAPGLFPDLLDECQAQVVRDPREGSEDGSLRPRWPEARLWLPSPFGEGLLDYVGQVVWVAHALPPSRITALIFSIV